MSIDPTHQLQATVDTVDGRIETLKVVIEDLRQRGVTPGTDLNPAVTQLEALAGDIEQGVVALRAVVQDGAG